VAAGAAPHALTRIVSRTIRKEILNLLTVNMLLERLRYMQMLINEKSDSIYPVSAAHSIMTATGII
jgi:hypothetical protein